LIIEPRIHLLHGLHVVHRPKPIQYPPGRKLMRKLLLSIALVTLVLPVACGGGESNAGATDAARNELVIAIDGSPTNLDCRIGNDQNSGRMHDLIYAGLVRIDTKGGYEPDLAESWDTPDDHTIVFHLRHGVTFQDGRPLTAKDVLFTYQSMMAPDFPGPKKSGYATVASIEAPDDYTVVFHMKETNPAIFDNLTTCLVPVGADPDVYRSAPIGAGPYKVADFRPDEKVVLEAFPNYHEGKPPIDHLNIRIIPDATTRVLELERGTIDFTLNSIPPDSVKRFEKDPDLQVIAKPGSIYQYIGFNLHNEALSKIEVRRAIAHAIDRERIVHDLLLGYGKVTETLFPPGHWAYADALPTYPFDPGEAKRLLDEAGYPDPDGDGPETRFTLLYRTSTDAESNQQAEMIQEMLRQIGVAVKIQSNEFGVFYEALQKGEYDIFSLRRAGVNDPDFYTYMFESDNFPPRGQNRGFYSNPEVDRLLAEGRATFDRAKRREIYVRIQRILAEDLPYVSLYHRYNIAIMKKNLEGYEMYPAAFLLSVRKMRWEIPGGAKTP